MSLNTKLELSDVGLGLRKVSARVSYSDFTDGGGASGTYTFSKQLPAGAFVIGTKVTVEEAAGGNESYYRLKVGTSSGDDDYTGGSYVDVSSVGVVGSRAEFPLAFISASTPVQATLYGDVDFGDITSGRFFIEVFYLSTAVELTDGHPGKTQ